MELGLLHDFFGNFSTQGERYYFHVESTLRENFGVVEGTLGHARWTQGEI